MTNTAFNLNTLARHNILQLKPYRCARDDYTSGILLDANENAFGPSLVSKTQGEENLHRYPDPRHPEVKELLCNLRNSEYKNSNYVENDVKDLKIDNIFLGVGSDEAIDSVIRCFCYPGKDKLLTCPPTYGMYGVSAQVNDIEVVKVNLFPKTSTGEVFQLDVDSIIKVIDNDSKIKIVYLCSPGNPTASLLSRSDIKKLLNHPFNGIIVVDEAYIDFAPSGASLSPFVTKYPNLVVLQTLSKAFGMAGIRLGMAYGSSEVISLLNNMKAPYNISSVTASLAQRALSSEGIALMKANRERTLNQRSFVLKEIIKIKGIGKIIGGGDSNFILLQILDSPTESGKPSNEIALKLYTRLAEHKDVVIRFRGTEYGCEGALRITIGTEKENVSLLNEIKSTLEEIYKE